MIKYIAAVVTEEALLYEYESLSYTEQAIEMWAWRILDAP